MVLELIKQYIDILRRGRLIDDVHADVRTVEEKSRDYVYGQDIQLPGSAVGKRIKKLPLVAYNQGKTLACGAYSAAHARRLEKNEEIFPLVWYRTRSNYPGGGMFIKEVLELIAYANKFPFPTNLPEELTEDYANNLQLVPVITSKDATREYYYIKPYDAEAVLEASTAGHSVLISFYSTEREWDEEMYPQDTVVPLTARIRHYVIVLPNSVHSQDGYEWVTVIDSSHHKGYSMRHVRKDFLEKRMFLGGGFVTRVKSKVTKPQQLPTRQCQYGQSNEDVLELQKFLVTQGLMSSVHTTSYYGNITAKAVLAWQMDNIKNTNLGELLSLEGKHWGPLSIKAVIDKHT